jgi:penicillin-binding protein 1A
MLDSKVKKSIKRIFKIIIIITLIFLSVSGGVVIGIINSAQDIDPKELSIEGYNTYIYDKDGEYVQRLKGEKNREVVSIEQTPKYLKNAFIAIEDKRFYEHNGVDLKRLIGAVIEYVKTDDGGYGASTITQQVVKNITGQTERSIKRKIQEQWKAIELEKNLTKDEIIEIYLNIIYLGNNYYGVQSAAKGYFGKHVSELSLAESAALAGITNSPANYSPYTEKGRKNIKARQSVILQVMYEDDYITRPEYDKAKKETLVYREKSTAKSETVQSYFVDQLVIDIKKGLMSKGYSEEQALELIYNGGLRIVSTIDQDLQKQINNVFTNKKYINTSFDGKEKSQAAMVILDPQNGQIRAINGGLGEKVASGLNRATSPGVKRQPGSTLKPLAVYGPAINEKLVTASTIIDDVPVHLQGIEKQLYPKNYSNTYGGLTTIRQGVKKSVNVIAAKVWSMNNDFPDVSLKYLDLHGISRYKERYIATSLGGLNEGVNVLNMAAAYVPFANGGTYYEPTTYTRVTNSKGEVILEHTPESREIYNKQSAYIITNVLQDVVKSGGTAYPYGIIKGGAIDSAGKTGTTSDNKDKWFVGYTPYYVGATWYGYDTPKTLSSKEYSNALKIWKDTMEKAHSSKDKASFSIPSGLVYREVCKYSGKLPTDQCSQDQRGDSRYTEVFIAGTQPVEYCDVHYSIEVCADTKNSDEDNALPGEFCPTSSIVSKTYIRRPEPFKQVWSNDPYPLDYIYERKENNEICSEHSVIDYYKDQFKNSKINIKKKKKEFGEEIRDSLKNIFKGLR